MVRRRLLDVDPGDGGPDRQAHRRVQRAGCLLIDVDIKPLDVSQPGVAARVVELQRAAYAVEADLIGFDGIPPLHDSVADVIAQELMWVGAYSRELLVGGLGYSDDGGLRDIDRLFVDPAWTRHGIGRALVSSVLDAPVVEVSTGTGNRPALALYESLGFRRTGERQIAPGVTVTTLLYAINSVPGTQSL